MASVFKTMIILSLIVGFVSSSILSIYGDVYFGNEKISNGTMTIKVEGKSIKSATIINGSFGLGIVKDVGKRIYIKYLDKEPDKIINKETQTEINNLKIPNSDVLGVDVYFAKFGTGETCDQDLVCSSGKCVNGLCEEEQAPVVCGDSVCDSQENCTTCPQDCGQCNNEQNNQTNQNQTSQNQTNVYQNQTNNNTQNQTITAVGLEDYNITFVSIINGRNEALIKARDRYMRIDIGESVIDEYLNITFVSLNSTTAVFSVEKTEQRYNDGIGTGYTGLRDPSETFIIDMIIDALPFIVGIPFCFGITGLIGFVIIMIIIWKLKK